MSFRVAQQALARLSQSPLFMFPENVPAFQASLQALAETDFADGQREQAENMQQLATTYGGAHDDERKPFAFANGVAVIPIHGSLLNRFNSSYSGATGYQFIRSQLRAAMADDDVKGILFDVNSPGGEAAGCFELAEEIRASRDIKPSAAIIDTVCASAAYALSSAAGKMYVVRSGIAGSIGVLMIHADVSRALDDFGVKITLLHSGKHKVDGNPFEPLPEAVQKEMQASIDEMRTEFATLVSDNRGLEVKSVMDTEARTYRGPKAVDAGLVDEVASVQVAVSTFMTALSGANQPENLQMQTPEQIAAAQAAGAAATTTQPAATAAAHAAPAVDAGQIRAAEQQRCQGILSLDAAKTNPSLAQHLAFKTSMSVEEATEVLAASAPAAAAAAPAQPANALEAAMATQTGGKPTVAPDGAAEAAAGSQAETLAQFDHAVFQSTGRKVGGLANK